MSLPRKTYARTIIRRDGYTEAEQAIEVASIDGVSLEEAARRVAEAKKQRINRSIAQTARHQEEKYQVEKARTEVLIIACRPTGFLCAKELENIARIAGWKSPREIRLFGDADQWWDTGRVFREICRPFEKAGLLQEICDEDDNFIGYRCTREALQTWLQERV